jgi:hypothetical protein
MTIPTFVNDLESDRIPIFDLLLSIPKRLGYDLRMKHVLMHSLKWWAITFFFFFDK